jgi:hypothetical protein
MDIRYTVILMEIKERGIANIKKKRRIVLIVAEFYMKLGVYIYIQSFLLNRVFVWFRNRSIRVLD